MTPRRSPGPSALPIAPAMLLVLTAALAGASRAQEPPPSGEPAPTPSTTPAKTQKVADLAGRYRFSERYTTDDEHTGPGVVGSCRVALLEVFKDSVESAQGAPRRSESSRQAIFTERPGEILGPGVVASTIRAFEGFRARPEDAEKAMGHRPLDGLSVYVRPKNGELPLVIGQAKDRTLTEYEYEVISRQVFLPQLVTLLPSQAVRIGDGWRLPRKAVQSLLGEPWIQDDNLNAKLAEVRKEVDGPRMVAAIAITGKVSGPAGESTVNAEALFTFQATSSLKAFSTKSTFPPRPTEDVIEARGAITEIRMTRQSSGPLPGPGRLRFRSNRELTIHRQLGLGAKGVAPPSLAKAPEATEANSWLEHRDPSGRYALRHPQDLLTQPPPEANTALLIRTGREGRDMLQVEFVARTLAPEDLNKELAEKLAMLKMEKIKGAEVWLPEAEWPGMRVHRIDADLKVADTKAAKGAGAPRVHFDGYLILFGQSASIMAIATTSRESVTPFRAEVEKILKTIRLDPPKSSER